jgi:hypothetical protein
MLKFLKRIFQRKLGFYFIHIPKTAGTSFKDILDAQVAEDEIFPCQLWHEINQDLVTQKDNYKLLRGHFGGGSYKILGNKNSHLLTILRHPVSLSISTYHFIKREKNTQIHDLVTKNNLTLEQFLSHPKAVKKINNRMVRHLSFDLQEDPEAQELFLSEQSRQVVKLWIKKTVNLNNQQRLIRAKKRLDNCSWIAILEKFKQSMQLFAYTFNLPHILEIPHLNAYRPNQDINAQSQKLILQENKYDLLLYQYACSKFDKKYQQMIRQLEKLRTSEQQSINELIDLHYIKNTKISKKNNSINYQFSQPLLGSGWHRRELTMPEKSFFRWTSHINSYIDFWLMPQDYELQIRIINAISTEYLESLTLLINNSNLEYSFDIQYGVVRIITAKIPAERIINNLLRITFKTHKLFQHGETFSSDDTRHLGLAVNWIKIR